MVMSPAGLETKNDCAGEAQQQFTRLHRGKGGRGYEILNQTPFNFSDSSLQNSVFSLYFLPKAEINTIK
jgi:hypothetical protein